MGLTLVLFVRINQSRAEESLERIRPVAVAFFAPRQPEGKRQGTQEVTPPYLTTTDNERLVEPWKRSMTRKWKQDTFVAISSIFSVTGYPLQYGLNMHHDTFIKTWQSPFRDTNWSQVHDYCSSHTPYSKMAANKLFFCLHFYLPSLPHFHFKILLFFIHVDEAKRAN